MHFQFIFINDDIYFLPGACYHKLNSSQPGPDTVSARSDDVTGGRRIMHIRRSTLNDLDTIMELYDKGRSFMRSMGNENQWINGYPSREMITDDINAGNSYLCIADEGDGCGAPADTIIGVFTYIFGIDPTYINIYEGQWTNDLPYAVVHRITVLSDTHGAGAFCLQYALDNAQAVRIDTHEDNKPMQKLLAKMGFDYCGKIYLEDGAPRIAFMK